MKAKQEQEIFRVLTGSHLYGNATAASDFDYKAVCLPPIDQLLLNVKITNRKEKPLGVSDSAKMKAGETETEYIPLQVFFNDFYNGQTYALELAFAFNQWKFEWSSNLSTADKDHVERMMKELVALFLTKNIKKMVGYAVSQSQLYGLKTQRYTTITTVLRILNEHGNSLLHLPEKERLSLTLNDLPDLLEKLKNIQHVKSVEIFNAAGGKDLAPGLDICGKQYTLTNKISTIVASLESRVLQYGTRVKEFDGEGVDWKALSHAIRISEQAVELCETGKISFPRPNALFLRDVKQGKISLETAMEYLTAVFNKIDDAVEKSNLPDKTEKLDSDFKEWSIKALRYLYFGSSHEEASD
jgi:hypothetical protein